jgi:hypothetical protein
METTIWTSTDDQTIDELWVGAVQIADITTSPIPPALDRVAAEL